MLRRVTEVFCACPYQIISLITCYDLSFLAFYFFCMLLNKLLFRVIERLSKEFSTHLQKDNDFQDLRNSPLQYFCPDFQINPTFNARSLKTWVPLLMPKLAMGTSVHMCISLTSGSQNTMCSPGWKMIYNINTNTFKISPGFYKKICSYTQELPAALAA